MTMYFDLKIINTHKINIYGPTDIVAVMFKNINNSSFSSDGGRGGASRGASLDF